MKTKNTDILEITQIKIKLSKEREIELSSDEARRVYEELGKLFEKEKTDLQKFKEEYDKIVIKKEYIPVPYPQPIYIERYPIWPRPWEITWCDAPYSTPITTTDPNIKFTCLSMNLVNTQ